MNSRTIWSFGIIALAIGIWLHWDLNQASCQRQPTYMAFKELSSFKHPDYPLATVAIVRSDDQALPKPIPINDSKIDYPDARRWFREDHQAR